MVKVAISGYYGFKNFGDEAILSVLTSHLKTIANTDITVFSSDCEFTEKTYGVKAFAKKNSFGKTKVNFSYMDAA